MTITAARAYCRRLARGHYENFTVASLLLPRHLRQHFANVYSYCRCADDLADETGDPSRGLALLDLWQAQLERCYSNSKVGGTSQRNGAATEPAHPVFVALAETIREFDIPARPLLDLLIAFRQDQGQTRYETFDELLGYCRYSANPVGRLVLFLGRCHTPDNVRLSDSICTGLQLANFWQDVARDFVLGRIYLPAETMRRFGCEEADVAARVASDALREALRAEVDRAEGFLIAGFPLVQRVPSTLRVDVELFIRGGLAVLAAIRRRGYDVLRHRPTVGKLQKARLLLSAWWNTRRRVTEAERS